MPPPEVVIILLPLKETTDMRPKLPLGRFLYVAPSDSAASSSTGTPYRSHSGSSASMSALWPYRFTTMTQRGSRFSRLAHANARSSASGDMFQLPGSASMNTGFAPQYRMGLQLPTK